MLRVLLRGGLGNQMFQYAFARSYSIQHSDKFELDVTFLEKNNRSSENFTARKFELDVFNLSYGTDTYKRNSLLLLMDRYFNRIGFRKVFDISETSFNYDQELLKIKNAKRAIGYFQSEKYFCNCRKELLDDFKIKSELVSDANLKMLKTINATNSIAVHIRRGDYVTSQKINSVHGLCGLEYYKKAIDYIAQRVINPKFYFFSDDLDWVRASFSSSNDYVFVDLNNDKGYLDLNLMKACKHNIIANSSFSWWGAWLNQNPSKIVVAPLMWFAQEDIDTSDLIPDSWCRL